MSRARFGGRCVRVAAFTLAALAIGASPANAQDHRIRLTYATFDPILDGPPAVPGDLSARPESREALLQFTGAPRLEWMRDLATLGVEFVDYVPADAFAVRLPAESRAAVAAHGAVRWLGALHPAYKIGPGIRGGEILLDVARGADATAVAAAAEAAGATVRAVRPHPSGGVVIVLATPQRIPALAAIDGVRFVQNRPVNRLVNDEARWVVQGGEPDRTPLYDRGLTGSGQVGAVSDSGVDAYDFAGGGADLDEASCYFRDDGGDGSTSGQIPPSPTHRKVVAYTVPADAGGDFDDMNGHGTHVVGSVVGDQHPWFDVGFSDGQAFAARIFFQDLNDDGSDFVFAPSDYRDMFAEAYDFNGNSAYESDLEPRTHSNSWGSVDPLYDAGSAQIDDFMWTHPDFLIFFAAGNQGPAPSTVGSPATAKNLVTVGATENGGGNEDNVASFSSHGPIPVANRLEPTVVAPGDGVVSALFDSPCGTQSLSGTSMATPTTQGVTLLLRQYLAEGFHPRGQATPADAHHPSAALMKALLVNSGRPMGGLFTDNGTGGTWPSNGQGWGRVTADDVLYFQGDHRSTALVDHYAVDGSVGFDLAGESLSYSIEVRDGAPFAAEPLEITLVWTDYPGTEITNGALVNNLNLAVTDPSGGIHFGNDPATNDFTNLTDLPLLPPDAVNPWEVVYVEAPEPGTWTITVTAASLPSLLLDLTRKQGFALVSTGDLTGSRGRAEIEFPSYDVSDPLVARLRVTDLDLDATSGPDSVDVLVKSNRDPAGEVVTLAETGASTGVFSGEVTLTLDPPGAGEVRVRDGNTVRLQYSDADDGTGGSYLAHDTAVIREPAPSLVNPPELQDPGHASQDGTYTLDWSDPEDTTDLHGYEVEVSTCGERLVLDDAEGALGDFWLTYDTPDAGRSWSQNSGYFRSPALSYWSGQGEELDDFSTLLELKPYVRFSPACTEARLTFWSRYDNDLDDTGRVQVSTDDGATWTDLLVLTDAALPPRTDARLQHHEVDLTPYLAAPFRLRFAWSNGTGNFVFYGSPGWWIDDVTIEAGAYSRVALVPAGQNQLTLTDQPPGHYFHRVRAIYSNATATAWSDVEDIVVPLLGEGTPGGSPPPPPERR